MIFALFFLSLSSMASAGQIPTQKPQLQHLFSSIKTFEKLVALHAHHYF